MNSNFGMLEPDSWGSYIENSQFQKAMSPGVTVTTTKIPTDWIPSPETIIWRFMDFTKFVALLNFGSLFFTRIDKLDDEFEGAWSDATMQLVAGKVRRSILDAGWKVVLYNEDTGQRLSLPLILKPVTPDAIPVLDRIHTDVRNLEYERITESCSYLRYRPTDHRFLIEKGKVKYQIGDIDSSLHATIETMRYANALSKFILVNCWHVGAHESDAMWSRYTDRNHAIAIKSDAASLVNSLVNRYPDAVGLVQYLSFDREVMPAPHLDMPYWFKRVQFEADRELRVVMDETVYLDTAEHIRTPDFSADICDVGLQYRIDPKILIHEVVLGPGTNEWVVDLVPEPIRIDRGKGDAVYPLRLGQ